MRPLLLLSLIMFSWTGLAAQAGPVVGHSIRFVPQFQGAPVVLASDQTVLESGDIALHELRFYISNVRLLQDDDVVWKESDSFHLLDAADPASLEIPLTAQLPGFDQLQFDLGIDSLTNVSGAFGGALDPTKGMYWAWHSGYINFKLEGRSLRCPTRGNVFQFHLGGYQPPFASVQTVRLPVEQSDVIAIGLDRDGFLAEIELDSQHTVMSPGAAGQSLSRLLAAHFYANGADGK